MERKIVKSYFGFLNEEAPVATGTPPAAPAAGTPVGTPTPAAGTPPAPAIPKRTASYGANLARANDDDVHQFIYSLSPAINTEIKNLFTKIENDIKNGKLKDTDPRNISTAIGSIFYNLMS